ncbi:MAG: NAD-dependent epimerase/dehydratase family protein [Planctomycetes bacterium]|nr:NAD-dependent epimerase/dehydratase family protein [Planctomycetota bacterium]
MSNRTFLVTGGAGFIGSHLVERLLARGDAVVVLDDFSTGRRGNLVGVERNARFEFVEGSVTDAALVERLVARCDEILHLAAVVGVRLVVEQPIRTMETNVRGTETVVTAAARHRRPLLVTSSSEVYGRGTRIPFREDDPVVHGAPTRTRWVYAASKLAAEHLALAHHREDGIAVRIVRFFNTCGPRQVGDFGMVLPRFVDQALAGGPVTIHGDGRQTRSFCHVADAVEAVLRVMAAPDAIGRPVNIGGTVETSVNELAQRVVAAVTGTDPRAERRVEIVRIPHVVAYGDGFDDPVRRVPDVSLLRELTAFVPSRPLGELIADAVRWAREVQACVAAGPPCREPRGLTA